MDPKLLRKISLAGYGFSAVMFAGLLVSRKIRKNQPRKYE